MSKPKKLDNYEIYTDGSFRLPNFGAYGFIILKNGKEILRKAYPVLNTTISRMELMAISEALATIKKQSAITIYSDSTYAVFSISKWVDGWKRLGWKNLRGETIKHSDIMEKFYNYRQKHFIKANWIKSHSGNKYNEEVDKMVQAITIKLSEDAKKLKL